MPLFPSSLLLTLQLSPIGLLSQQRHKTALTPPISSFKYRDSFQSPQNFFKHTCDLGIIAHAPLDLPPKLAEVWHPFFPKIKALSVQGSSLVSHSSPFSQPSSSLSSSLPDAATTMNLLLSFQGVSPWLYSMCIPHHQ